MTRILSCAALAAAFLAGCSSGKKIVPVSGIVLLDGVPLTQGKVSVYPADERPAVGDIGPDGRFTLQTYGNKDGVAIGTHPVVVFACETLSPSSQKWLVPKKYADREGSGLSITVDKATNDAVINISWEGGKPYVEHSSKEK